MHIWISKGISDEHFCKAVMHPKKLLHIYLTMRSVSGWSDKALYPPIWQIWNDSDPIFHLLSLCLLGLAPTRTIRSPSQKKTKMFSFNRAGAGSHDLRNVTKIIYFSLVNDKNYVTFLYILYSSQPIRDKEISHNFCHRPMRDRERSHNFCDLS